MRDIKVLTQDRVKELFYYSIISGKFYRKTTRGGFAPNTKCISVNKKYIPVCIDYKKYAVHRLAFLYVTGAMPFQVDHINHNGQDNRWINLRGVSHKENHRNTPMFSNNTSGFCGVYWSGDRNKWAAVIKVDGKSVFLGRYISKQDAIKARMDANIKYGFHPNHGNQEPDK